MREENIMPESVSGADFYKGLEESNAAFEREHPRDDIDVEDDLEDYGVPEEPEEVWFYDREGDPVFRSDLGI